MTNWGKWKRTEHEPDSLSKDDAVRRIYAERETKRDLQKPIQQLICDVHEGMHDPNKSPEERLLYMSGRTVSMMGRVALEHERTSKRLVWLTWFLILLTILLAIETAATIYPDLRRDNPSNALPQSK
jgi:hypothetical protein